MMDADRRCASCGRRLARQTGGQVVGAVTVGGDHDEWCAGCYGDPAAELERARERAAARIAKLDQAARATAAKAAARTT